MKRDTVVRGIKISLFLIIFVVIYRYITIIFSYSIDARNYQWVAGFFEERENSLDAVYLGSSDTYAFWQAPIAFEQYGITVRPLCCNSQPLAAAKYLIEETRKKYPDALYIIPINNLTTELEDTHIHYLTDYYPLSVNKIKMIWAMADYAEEPYSKRMEYFFPIVRYHPRWDSLQYDDFNYKLDGLKGASYYDSFLEEARDVSDIYCVTQEREELTPKSQELLLDLLEYCKQEEVNVLFITVPQILSDEQELARYNTANDIIESNGFPVLDLSDKVEEIGLDLTTDYYNAEHTNIHGSIKWTHYISQYLIENYDFEDKRNQAEFQDWTDAVTLYRGIISPYIREGEVEEYLLR